MSAISRNYRSREGEGLFLEMESLGDHLSSSPSGEVENVWLAHSLVWALATWTSNGEINNLYEKWWIYPTSNIVCSKPAYGLFEVWPLQQTSKMACLKPAQNLLQWISCSRMKFSKPSRVGIYSIRTLKRLAQSPLEEFLEQHNFFGIRSKIFLT